MASWFSKSARTVRNVPAKLHHALFSEDHFVTTLKRSVYLSAATAVIAIISLMASCSSTEVAVPDTTADFNRLLRVEFVGENFLELWLTATEADGEAVKQMLADPSLAPPEWNTEALNVSQINLANVESADDPHSDITQWSLVYGATLTIPGSDIPTRAYYAVTLIDTPGSNVRALGGPRPVFHSRPNITVQSGYTHAVNASSPLYQTVRNFIATYYTSEAAVPQRYVASDFNVAPLSYSAYTSAELVSLRTTESVSNAASGTTVQAMATIKAGISQSTFHTISVPMTLRATDNKQWLIADLPNVVYFSTQGS